MNTVAWLLILTAGLMIRGIAKGRVVELPGDLRDMLLGALTGDFEAVKEAAGRTGDGLTAPLAAVPEATAAGLAGSAGTSAAGSAKGAALLAEARRIGKGRPYIWGATFANGRGGDCSGLVWRAMYNLGYYRGGRFTTYTFPVVSPKFATVVTTPAPGDIAVWQKGGVNGHMGIVSGPGVYWSALNRRSGVLDAPIKNMTGRLTYYRLK